MNNKKQEIYNIGEAQEQPNDKDTERTVLATLMFYHDVYDKFADLLNADLFYDDEDRAIYRCIEGVIKAHRLTDVNSLYDYAKSNDVGFQLTRYSFVEIVQLMSLQTIEQDIARLRNLSKRRMAWKQLQIAAMKVQRMDENADDVINGIISTLNEIQQDASDVTVSTFKEAVGELTDIVNGNLNGKSISIKTGFKIFDNWYLLRPDTLTIIAAFTSVGKSALAMNIAINTARQGIGVGYYSLEMGKAELAARGLSGDALLSASSLMNKKLYETEIQQYQNAVQKNQDLPIYIDERATVSFDKTVRSIRTLRKSRNIGLAIIDYLQIYTQTGETVESSLAYMARAAKNVAKELDMPVILLSQLNRSSSHPSIKMLRGSGQIEESADNIVLIDRPEAYPDNDVQRYEGEYSDQPTHNTAKLILAKGRGVGTGSELVGFEGRYTQFYELENQQIQETPMGRVEDEAPF